MFQMSAGGKGLLHGKLPGVINLTIGPEVQKVGEAPKDIGKAQITKYVPFGCEKGRVFVIVVGQLDFKQTYERQKKENPGDLDLSPKAGFDSNCKFDCFWLVPQIYSTK